MDVNVGTVAEDDDLAWEQPDVLVSVHKCLRICDLCKELAFGHQCVNGLSRDSYNSLEFNVLWRQFLESRHAAVGTANPKMLGRLMLRRIGPGGPCQSKFDRLRLAQRPLRVTLGTYKTKPTEGSGPPEEHDQARHCTHKHRVEERIVVRAIVGKDELADVDHHVKDDRDEDAPVCVI